MLSAYILVEFLYQFHFTLSDYISRNQISILDNNFIPRHKYQITSFQNTTFQNPNCQTATPPQSPPQNAVTGGDTSSRHVSNQHNLIVQIVISPQVQNSIQDTSDEISPRVVPLPENRVVVGCGAVGLDMLATVASYPKPDDKIRSTSLKVQGGGNAGNALTCAARLGLNPRIISKVADDTQGKGILEELEADGVDTSFLVVSKGNSPFTYIIVDSEMNTRTCIHTPGYPPMIPDDLPQSRMLSALDMAKLVYFDGRLHETALVIAEEAARKNVPILIDAERKREGLDDLLSNADYAVCSAKFPQELTGAPSIPSALVSMLLRLPKLKFVIVTLGEDGCIMLERNENGESKLDEMDVDRLLDFLKQKKDGVGIPTCVSSPFLELRANDIGTVSGRLLVGTAEKIPPSGLIDTTGAGDAFIGAVLYAICAGMTPDKMLPFASKVAAACCKALGSRTGLPYRTDPCLSSYLQ